MKHISLGKEGENVAENYLKKKGYSIFGRNYSQKFGEIDIIAKDPDGCLVFVEVKTLLDGDRNELTPEDNLTKSKFQKLSRICSAFVNANSRLINEEVGWRIDLVAIVARKQESGEEYEIRHYEHISA